MKIVIALMIVLSTQFAFAETEDDQTENPGSVITIRELK